ncbi:MAG: restriction endonuclease subunit M [Calditrichaeota bacterium]|nr:MAG: restriction endonuclease subunit M [Calditrichota bacterium]MBL1207971.1 restriction endonuclease subunit M [Calditrichota bacterium]NOG47807.1 N-6 DNA methylase [Calditrichota bacterium]
MILTHFKDMDFLKAVKALFKELKVPMNYVADEPTTAKEILKDTYKDNTTFQLVDDVYFVGMVDDAAFEGTKSLDVQQIKSDYDGVLIFGLTLYQRENNLLPTRSQLAEISRAFNREFYYTPVVLVLKYRDDQADYLAFANTERLQYKQAWREGEKAGRVSLLRDINIIQPHSGHERILLELKIPSIGTKTVDSFAKLYAYWQEVFSVSVLNKKFYQELSNWYFWAIKHVTFPNKPTLEIAHQKGAKLDDLIQEHNATNVIRLLTRLLFTWFIKEKKLIPEELFDLKALQKDILNDISPYHEEGTMFAQANKESIYYKAILQNLFFATLNCPIEEDSLDKRSRRFRLKNHYGQDRGNDWMYRYEKYFKNPDVFLKLMNEKVPFLNGGLFECLDIKHDQNLYIDGFSDQMTRGEQLIVPDYLFFGVEEHVDLSAEYGVKNKAAKEAAVKGLVNILKSYKFTITENTPIEEDVALDPELLGKVFENLLASYNPETKSTARKQTGSFYTPREIVNYMVDESLIAYLKNAETDWAMDEKALDEKLHQLTSFDPVNPFKENTALTKRIVKALDECKILDPACGSGAFLMGGLQKMVHMLQKLDPKNSSWKEVQTQKAEKDLKEALSIEDKNERGEKLKEINEAFDQNMNDPDYARKLYLIENCVYGVDIQPIATQIAKLRFFISLVVDQKVAKKEANFGIRPLPNLETKFVTANTLIGIDKPQAQTNLFDNKEIKQLEAELKKVRHKLFSARTKDTKLKYRKKDEELRNAIAGELKRSGLHNDSAEKLAGWDPYDQNASSLFFDPKWMFDISGGFDVVIGNPPYGVSIKGKDRKEVLKHLKKVPDYEIYYFFIEVSSKILNSNKGILSYIIPNTYLFNVFAENYRDDLIKNWGIKSIIDFTNYSLFDTATVRNSVIIFTKGEESKDVKYLPTLNSKLDLNSFMSQDVKALNISLFREFSQNWALAFKLSKSTINAVANIKLNSKPLNFFFPEVSQGLIAYDKYQGQHEEVINSRAYHHMEYRKGLKRWLWGEDITKYSVRWNEREYIDYCNGIANPRQPKFFKEKRMLIREITNPSIFAAITDEELYNDPAILVVLNSIFSLEAATIILNSRIGTFFHFNASPKATKGDFPKILVKDIKEFPLSKNLEKVDKQLWKSLYNILEFDTMNSSISNSIYNVTDGLCLELYFPDHMKEREIDVLEFVERDINQALQGREFNNLSETEKERVIEQLHATWSHTDNEVRNRIKLFAVRSPEILKPILES